jgi:DNA gyrase subunit A
MVIQEELRAVRNEYKVKRRTEIGQYDEAVYEEKPEEETDVAFIMDRFGYAKTIDAGTYEKNRETIKNDFTYSFIMKNTGRICVFTSTGSLHTIKAQDLPAGKMRDKGVPIDNVSNYDTATERIVAVLPQSSLNLYRLLFVTGNAMIKLVGGGEFDVTRKEVAATKLSADDELIAVMAVTDEESIVLRTENDMALRFRIEEIPEQKKNAAGVHGMTLAKNDSVRDAYLLKMDESREIIVSDKKYDLGALKISGRNGKGSRIKK